MAIFIASKIVIYIFLCNADGCFHARFKVRVQVSCLTHWGRLTHICVCKLTIIGSDNGLSPGRRQAIIWNNAGLLIIEPLGTNFSEISIGIQRFSFKKMHLNMSSAKRRPFCLGLNELIGVSNILLFSRRCKAIHYTVIVEASMANKYPPDRRGRLIGVQYK